ncbi:MAG: hypothetical protein NTW29_01940 [Bacteroidetes bacterium]|nr:hypothetical protein [Bacteroidota bacterium]
MKMMISGKLFPVLAVLFFVTNGHAQVNLKTVADAKASKQSENLVRSVNDLKTGNWQTVLTSFAQLALKDLAGDNKTLSFKASLFALKAKADSNLLQDINYVKQKFARNFQFDFALKLDTSYRFKGLQAGFTWALVNKRDSSVVSFANTTLDTYYSAVQESLATAKVLFRNSLIGSNGNIPDDKRKMFNDVSDKIEKLLGEKGFVAKSEFPKEIQPFIDDSFNTNLEMADKEFAKRMAALRIKPLLTLTVNSTFENKERALSNGYAGMVYLQGIRTKRTKTEMDIRSSISVRDTLVVTTQRRTRFNASAGINFALLESNKDQTLIEFKPYLEYNSILTKPIGAEKKDQFTANADLRIRLFENFWLPFTIKYDVENGKFFGFLDIEFNFNAFKSKK